MILMHFLALKGNEYSSKALITLIVVLSFVMATDTSTNPTNIN